MKKNFLKFMAVTLSTILFTSCAPSTPVAETSKSPSTEQEKTEEAKTEESKTSETSTEKITVWAWDPKFNVAIMNEAANRYKKINPNVTIEVVDMAKADVEQKLHTNLASKINDNLPDIVLIEDYNSQKYLQSYEGAFADLTNSFNFNDFAKYKVELMTLDNKVYGVPFDTGVTGLFYRSDILEEAGYKADSLKNITWDDFISIAKEVKAKTGKALLSFDKQDGGLMRVMMQSAGNWYFDKDGNAAIEGNEVLKEAMRIYSEIEKSDIIIPATSWNDWVAPFNKGDAASVSTGVWIIGSIKTAADQSGKWAVAPIPKLSVGNSVNASNLGGSSWYVLDSSKAKDTAIDFLNKTFASDVDFYQNILVNNGAVGSYLPAQTGESYTEPDPFFGGQKVYEDMSVWIKEIPAINYGIYTYEADAAVMGQMAGVYSGSVTIDQALAAAQSQLKQQIGQ